MAKNPWSKTLAVLLGIILIFPVYWMVIGSLQNIYDIVRMPPRFIPASITLKNFSYFVQETPLLRWLANSLLINTLSVLLTIACTITASYALAVYRFAGRQVFYWAFVATLMVPGTSLFVPRFVLMRHLHIINTIWPVIIVGAFAAGNIIIVRNYFMKVPKDFLDSARIDGATEAQTFWHIMLPQCKPILGYMFLTQYIGAFQDWFWPMLIIKRREWETLPLGIMRYMETWTSTHSALSEVGTTVSGAYGEMGMRLAGGVILFIPIVFVFIIFQRFFRTNFLAGGIKE